MTITLDSGWIPDVSMDNYTVGDTEGCTISNSRYSRFLDIINTRLSKDGLLDSAGEIKTDCEYLAALLVCDLISRSKMTDYGIKQENYARDYAYTKTDDAANNVTSSFMLRYEDELSTRTRSAYATTYATREDAEIEFAKICQGPYPQIDDSKK